MHKSIVYNLCVPQDEERIMSTFGKQLFEARKRAKLTQEELGEQVGVGGSYISRLERGIYPPPSREVMLRLADALGMSDKADLKRLQFLSAAGVVSDEDLKGFRLVQGGAFGKEALANFEKGDV